MIIPYATSAVTRVRGQDVIDLFNQKVAEYSEDYPYTAFIVLENTTVVTDASRTRRDTSNEYSYCEIMSKWPIYHKHDNNFLLGYRNYLYDENPVYGPIDIFLCNKDTPPSQREHSLNYCDETRIIFSTITSQRNLTWWRGQIYSDTQCKYTAFCDTNFQEGFYVTVDVPTEKLDRPTRSAYYTYIEGTATTGTDKFYADGVLHEGSSTLSKGLTGFRVPYKSSLWRSQTLFTNTEYGDNAGWGYLAEFKPRFSYLMSSNNPDFSSYEEWTEYLREHGAFD